MFSFKVVPFNSEASQDSRSVELWTQYGGPLQQGSLKIVPIWTRKRGPFRFSFTNKSSSCSIHGIIFFDWLNYHSLGLCLSWNNTANMENYFFNAHLHRRASSDIRQSSLHTRLGLSRLWVTEECCRLGILCCIDHYFTALLPSHQIVSLPRILCDQVISQDKSCSFVAWATRPRTVLTPSGTESESRHSQPQHCAKKILLTI